MQQHAMALGYFFLAAFCLFTSAHSFAAVRIPLLLAALLALIAGVSYVASPLVAGISALSTSLVKLIRLAQQPPTRSSTTTDETSAERGAAPDRGSG